MAHAGRVEGQDLGAAARRSLVVYLPLEWKRRGSRSRPSKRERRKQRGKPKEGRGW